jgi:hypothetical protein
MRFRASHVVLGALALGCQACASFDAPAAGDFQYARDVGARPVVHAADEKGEVTIVWRFGTPEWVNNMCGGKPGAVDVFGCSMRDPQSDRCVMFLVTPSNFQDRDHLAVLGHELWHCQGARHS